MQGRAKKEKQTDPGKMTFEDSVRRLEEIVRRMEEEKVPLEESITLYEEGMRLGKKCRVMLEDAQKRIKRLAAEMEDENGA